MSRSSARSRERRRPSATGLGQPALDQIPAIREARLVALLGLDDPEPRCSSAMARSNSRVLPGSSMKPSARRLRVYCGDSRIRLSMRRFAVSDSRPASYSATIVARPLPPAHQRVERGEHVERHQHRPALQELAVVDVAAGGQPVLELPREADRRRRDASGAASAASRGRPPPPTGRPAPRERRRRWSRARRPRRRPGPPARSERDGRARAGSGAGAARRAHRGRAPGYGKTIPCSADAVLGDLIAHRAAAVLDDGEEARQPIADPLAPHDDDGIGDGADVPRGHLAGDEVLELRLLGRHEQERGHRGCDRSGGRR